MGTKMPTWKVHVLRVTLFVFILIIFAALPQYLEKVQVLLHNGESFVVTDVNELNCANLNTRPSDRGESFLFEDRERFCVYEVFYNDEYGSKKSAITKYLTIHPLYDVGDTIHVDGYYVLESYWDLTPYNYRVLGLMLAGGILFLFIDKRFF